ncbi:MAG: C10 family peptidase, partial [Lentisphaeria bacterium]|nr:C10 family peptidase [Lentisphaeria bacterium]
MGTAESVADAFIGYEQAKSEIYRAALGIPADAWIAEVNVLTDGASLDTLAYVFELKPSGYIVVTADTQIVPIVAYSFTGTFLWEESTENILLDMLRQDMANRLRAAQDGQMDARVAADNEWRWEEYRGTRVPDRATYEVGVYGPWTLDPWSQGSPYWDDCPMDPNEPPVGTHRCVVGCVATALAQILNYWQTPTSVTFQASDDYTSSIDLNDGYGTRTIPITAATANFSGLNYNNCSPSDAVKADLSFAAGVSVRMNYSSAGSGASQSSVAAALAGSTIPFSAPPQRWGYHSADLRTYDPTYTTSSPYFITQTAFFNDLKSNMMQAQPAQMGITNSTGGGHSILVDGYHPTSDDYHLNYGWGTSSYGWYSLPSGMPSGYDILKCAVYNIVPTTSTYTMSTSTSGAGTGTVQALPGTGALTQGIHVLVSATPAPGSSFSNWTGDLSGSDNPAMVILDGNKSVEAVFTGGGGPVSSKKWTIMVYLAADNDLGGGTPSDPDFLDFDEIETALVSSGSALDVIVLWDKPGTNDTYIYWVQPDGTQGSLATYTLGVNKWTSPGGPEENMGAQSTLTNFLDWVFYYFDSDYYGLILWNHGSGWAPKSEMFDEPINIPPAFVSIDGKLSDIQLPLSGSAQPLLNVEKPSLEEASRADIQEDDLLGICSDDTDSDYLTTKEAAFGIENSTRGRVENLGLDACLMGMLEVAYEFYNTPNVAADYLTASEASEWGYGWAYHQILSPITTSTTPL